MAPTPPPTDTTGLRHWHVAGTGPALVSPGDLADAKQALAASIGDDAALSRLRLKALSLADGSELSRLDEHAFLDHFAAAVAEGRLRAAGPRPSLLPFVPAAAPARAPAPATPARARPSAPAAPDASPEVDLDVAAMIAVLTQAARDGVPFCEECERARAAQAAQGTA